MSLPPRERKRAAAKAASSVLPAGQNLEIDRIHSGRFESNVGTRAMRSIGWGGRQQIIYKHAISTIAPIRPVDVAEELP